MRLCILFAALLFSSPAFAQGQINVETFCRLLPEYKPAAGVEYQPGVDVHGQFVAPADLSGGQMRSFESIEIPVEMDLIQKFGLNAPASADLKPIVALVSVHNDGKVEYNGQDITAQARLACGRGK